MYRRLGQVSHWIIPLIQKSNQVFWVLLVFYHARKRFLAKSMQITEHAAPLAFSVSTVSIELSSIFAVFWSDGDAFAVPTTQTTFHIYFACNTTSISTDQHRELYSGLRNREVYIFRSAIIIIIKLKKLALRFWKREDFLRDFHENNELQWLFPDALNCTHNLLR